MSVQRKGRGWLVLGLVGLVCTGASRSFAQEKGTPPLRGPEVTDRQVPGVAPDFGGGDVKRRMVADRVPPEVYRNALEEALGPGAPDTLRATPEQHEKIKSIISDFESQAKSFREAHKDELAALRRDAGEMRSPRARTGNGQAAPADAGSDQSMTDMSPDQQKRQEEARAKLRQLMESAPKPEEMYTKVWAELNDAQKKAVDAHIQVFRDTQAKRREDAYVRQRAAKKNPRPARDEGQAVSSDAAAASIKERRDRLLKIFDQLPAQEQELLLNRLEQRLRNGPDGPRPDGAKRAPKPPVDAVSVPSPEAGK